MSGGTGERVTYTIETINALDATGFVAVLGPLFEGSPWIAQQTWAQRPFADATQLHGALVATMQQAAQPQQIALIQAHPDLAGKAALAGTLTAESRSEQSSAGLDQLAAAEFADFNQLNGAYRERFGFPFVICVREQTKDSILASFRPRLGHSREQEIATALGEIAKIARLRLNDMLADGERR